MKPNIGPLDTQLPTENRYDEWLYPFHEKTFKEYHEMSRKRNKEYLEHKNKVL